MGARTRVERTVLDGHEHYLELPNDGRRYEIIEGSCTCPQHRRRGTSASPLA